MCNHPDRPQMRVVLRIFDAAGAAIAEERWVLCPQCLAIRSDRLAEARAVMGRQEHLQAHRGDERQRRRR